MQTKFIITFIAESFLTCVFAVCLSRCTGLCECLGLFVRVWRTSAYWKEHHRRSKIWHDYFIVLPELRGFLLMVFYKLTSWRSFLLPVTNDQKRVTARRQVFFSKLKMPFPASGTGFLDWNHNVRLEDRTQQAGGCRSITPLVRTFRRPRRIGWRQRLWADNVTKRNRAWGCGPDSCGSRWSPVPGYCEHVNEHSGVMNWGEFLYCLDEISASEDSRYGFCVYFRYQFFALNDQM
jgi:hypothetical protein